MKEENIKSTIINNNVSNVIIEHLSNKPNTNKPKLDTIIKKQTKENNDINIKNNTPPTEDTKNINSTKDENIDNKISAPLQTPNNKEQKKIGQKETENSLNKYIIWSVFALAFIFSILMFIVIIGIEFSNPQTSNQITTQQIQGNVNNNFYHNLLFLISAINAIVFIVWITVIFLYYNTQKDDTKTKSKYSMYIKIVSAVFVFLLIIISWVAVLDNEESKVIARIKTDPINPRGDGPMMVLFDASDFGNNIKFYEWDFGDNTKGNGMVVSHNYEKIGNFNVKLKMITNKGINIESSTEVIINNLKPKAVIKVDKNKGATPLNVLFDSSSSKDPNGNIISYTWLFPDNTVHNTNSTQYTFEKEGKWPVTLIVQDNNGSTGADVVTIEVTAVSKPEAIIDIKPDTKGGVPFSVMIDGTKSKTSNNNSSIVQYEWNLGDNSNTLFGGKINHTYEKPGKFLITLTITDSLGMKATNTKIVEVTPNIQLPTVVIKTIPPMNNAQKEITGPAPLLVKFDGSSSNAIGEKKIIDYQWDFGDGSPILYGEKINYTYNTPGEYEAILTIKDSDGLYNTAIVKIKVTNPTLELPVMDIQISGNKKSFYAGDTIEFDASHSYSPSGEIMAFDWDFGDGQKIISGAKTSHIFNNPGHYKVVVKGIDNNGKSSTAELKIAIQHMPIIAKISKSHSSGPAPLKVLFNANNSVGVINKYEWDFGDGNKSTDKNPEHVYTTPGIYKVTLKIIDIKGIIDTASTTITVE